MLAGWTEERAGTPTHTCTHARPHRSSEGRTQTEIAAALMQCRWAAQFISDAFKWEAAQTHSPEEDSYKKSS